MLHILLQNRKPPPVPKCVESFRFQFSYCIIPTPSLVSNAVEHTKDSGAVHSVKTVNVDWAIKLSSRLHDTQSCFELFFGRRQQITEGQVKRTHSSSGGFN